MASTMAALPGVARAAVSRQTIRFIVVDGRISESKALAAALSREGAQRLEVTSGLTAVWKDHLYPHWQGSRGGAVVGLTTRSVWDGLSQQAHGQFRRGRIIGVHQIGATSKNCQHRIEAHVRASITTSGLALSSEQWPQEVAQIMAQYSQQRGCPREAKHFGPAIPAQDLRHQLVSWIIE
jgi:hypothetical protein